MKQKKILLLGGSAQQVIAIKTAKEEQADGILAYASDPAALPAAIVAERLGLPANPVKSVEILGLKFPWRKFLHEHGFACPKFFQPPLDSPPRKYGQAHDSYRKKPVVSTSANVSGEPAAQNYCDIDPKLLELVDYVCWSRRQEHKPHKPSSIVKLSKNGEVKECA